MHFNKLPTASPHYTLIIIFYFKVLPDGKVLIIDRIQKEIVS